MKAGHARIVVAVLFVALLAGCAATQPVSTRRYVWPPPPDTPRIEFLKSYFNEDDFPKSGFGLFMETVFGKPPLTEFMKPLDIKSNGKGLVYITDPDSSALFVYDLVNYKIIVWRRGERGDEGLSVSPFFVALDQSGNVYVAGSGDKAINVLDRDGKLLRKIDWSGKVEAVAGIAVDEPGGRIYVVDSRGSKVAVFDLAGKHLFEFGKLGDGDGEFNRPLAITISSAGEVLVGDTMNARIQIFDKNGKFKRKFGERGDGEGEFQILKGVAVDSDDHIYVTDGKASKVKIFSNNGEYLMTVGAPYSVSSTRKDAPGGMLLPNGIHIDNTDTIYLTDEGNIRFQVFRYLKQPTLKGDDNARKTP